MKVHQDHQVIRKTIYLAFAINIDGYKELFGIWIGEHEGATFWGQVLTELSNRGVKDVFVFYIDGLTGFPEAIKGIYPKQRLYNEVCKRKKYRRLIVIKEDRQEKLKISNDLRVCPHDYMHL